MDKKTLQNEILEQKYQPKQWLEVLKIYFGVNKILEQSQIIENSSTDWVEYVEKASELGSFYTADERLVGIYEVMLKPKAWIEINRVGLRNLLRQVYKYDVDAALIVFVQDSKWRFSYVSEIRTEEGKRETEPKRFTYLFGKGETCRTAADRFDKLKGKPIYLNDLFDAFSVDKLNKDFFKTYKEFFESFCEHLAINPEYRKILLGSSAELAKSWKDEKAKPIRDFAKKLLGRIVFLQFLQKKEWMGVPASSTKWKGGDKIFIQTLFSKYNDQEHFHSKALRKLFFETLNLKRDNDIAPSAIGDKIRIPYLNGGLFDKDISYYNDIDFPISLFKSLLDFFEQYNFTIDENDPYDREVGIDPEMLGHIFENLLEENREKGAFYTPKDVVKYMCQESLIEYLQTHLPSDNRAEIEQLVRLNRVSETFTDYKKANEINNLLKQIKICDPAIGSGAFPMGLLKEIFDCRRLLYGYLRTNIGFDPAIVKKEIIQNNIYGVDIDPGAVDIARLRFWLALVVDENAPQPLPNLDYKIMQGNSLLEQFDNIDLKFDASKFKAKPQKQKNLFGEILETNEGITEYLQNKQDSQEFDITELEDKFFDINNPDEKQIIRNKIEDFEKKFIDEQLDKRLKEIKDNLESAKTDIEYNEALLTSSSEGITKVQKEKYQNALKTIERRRKDAEKQQKEIDRLTKKRTEIQNINPNSKPYFLWHLYYLDVFNKGGFDIVIGNPPFIQLQRMGDDSIALEKAKYSTFAKTGDIYCLFYELGNTILKPHGVLSFITSNKWMTAGYGKNFRKFLLEKTNPILLIDFSKAVIFPTAVVFVNIMNFKKEKNQHNLWAAKAQSDFQIGKTPLNEYIREVGVYLSDQNEDNWSVADKRDFDITLSMDRIGTSLKECGYEFYRGITSGFNDAFHINIKTRLELIEEDPKSNEIIKPLLRGKDIKRWGYHFENLYLINSHNGVREKEIPRIDVPNDYPAIYRYLSLFKDKESPNAIKNADGTFQTLIDRADQGDHWTNLRNCAFIEEFEKDKIIWIEISDRANYCLDTNGHYLTNSAYFLTGENLKYLLCILNSKLMDFYFFQKTAQIAGGRKRYTKQYVELLPIIKLEDKILLEKFEIICDYLTYLNNPTNPQVNPYTSNLDIVPFFEDLLNMMVYELYFEQHLVGLEIDILKFINVQEQFLPINHKNDTAKVIGDAYKWLQDKDNIIRNRIILSNIRSTDIIRRINSTTH